MEEFKRKNRYYRMEGNMNSESKLFFEILKRGVEIGGSLIRRKKDTSTMAYRAFLAEE